MSRIKKFALGGVAVVLAAVIGFTLLPASPVYAAATDICPGPTTSDCGDPEDHIVAPGSDVTLWTTFTGFGPAPSTEAVQWFRDGTDSDTGTAATFGNGSGACTIVVTTATTGLDSNCDDGTATVNSTTPTLRITMHVASGSGAGTLEVDVYHTDDAIGDTYEEDFFVTAAAGGQVHDFVPVAGADTIGDDSGTALVRVRANDASGNAVNGVDVRVEAENGLLLQGTETSNMGECATGSPVTSSTLPDTAYVDSNCNTLTGGTGTSAGRASVMVMEDGTLGQNVCVNFFEDVEGEFSDIIIVATSHTTAAPAVEEVCLEIVGPAAAGQVTIVANPTSVPTGGQSTITVTAKDADGDVVADDTAINVEATQGTITGCSNAVVGDLDTGMTRDGVVTCTFTAPPNNATVTITATAVTPGTAADIVASTTVIVGTGTQVTPTATATPACTGRIISGSIPRTGGFGLIVAGCGTIQQIETNTGCPIATMALWATRGGEFIVHVPGTNIGAVNAPFFAVFPGGNIPENEPFVGKCV